MRPALIPCLVGALVAAGCGSGASTASPASSPSPVSVATPGAPSAAPDSSPTPTTGLALGADWTTYGGDAARSSHLAEGPDPRAPRSAWAADLDGSVYASPLVVGGTVIAATENNTLYALAGGTGKVLWKRHLSSPVPREALPCGNIDPLGITGTPVYDPATRLVFAVATVSGVHHVLYGIDARTGQVRLHRPVDVPGMEPPTHLQRAALLLAHDRVYIAYGGNYGDCGQYRGRVVSAPTAGAGPLSSYTVPTSREAGIWGASGPALLPSGDLLVSTGNGAATGGSWDHSDSVLRLSPALALQDGFAPREWAQENSADADLGSMGPLPLPGATQVLTAGKGGNVFLLATDRLGGVAGQVWQLSGCSAYGGGAALRGAAILPCNDGLLQVRVTGHQLRRGWKSDATGLPLVVGSTCWIIGLDGLLLGLDVGTGRQVARLDVGSATRFAKPAASGNALLLPTKKGVTAVLLRTP